MTLKEAVNKKISKVRRPMWANPNAHLRFDILANGSFGPWVHLYDSWGQKATDVPVGSQSFLWPLDEHNDYVEFEGDEDA